MSVTYSLNDTFWVKPADSSLRWQDVSLYQNDFDEIIAEVALNGSFSEQSLSSLRRSLAQTATMPSAGSGKGRGFICTKPAAPPMNWSRCRNIWPASWQGFCAPVL